MLLPLVCSCGGAELSDARHSTGSQTIVASSDYSALYVANTQEGSITRLPAGGQPTNFALEGEPTRLARAGDRVFVSLRANREVAVLEDDGSTLHEIGRVRVGHEPFGVVANEQGTRVYVASSLSNTIQEIDASSLAVLREFEVSDEPRWLALHPGNTLYVGAAWRGSLFSIDLDEETIVRTELPRAPLPLDLGSAHAMSARITGDMSVTPNGDKLLVPTMYADTQTPVMEPEPGESNEEVMPFPVESGYGGSGGDGRPGRLNPTVTIVSLDGEHPRTEDGTIVPMRAFSFDGPVMGYASSVVAAPDGDHGYATIEGAGGLVVFTIEGEDGKHGIPEASSDAFFESGLFESRVTVGLTLVRGLRGLAFLDERRAAAYGFLDRMVVELDIEGAVASDREGQFLFVNSQRRTVIERSNLSPEVELGRDLFYATSDHRMSGSGSGLSCATCHFDVRSDGFTWNFERGPRQTPSLAGKVSLTAPVRWEGDRETVAIDAMRTSQGLMGGRGLTENETFAIEAFIDSTRDVDSPLKGEENDAVERGRAIFNRTDVGCANCHSGERYTNNQSYSMFDMPVVKTRSLVGVAGSPPYLHDGSAATLEEVLERSKTGAMGYTGSLSDREHADLAAFLKSL